jgi:hypothetical protein
MAPNELAQLKT